MYFWKFPPRDRLAILAEMKRGRGRIQFELDGPLAGSHDKQGQRGSRGGRRPGMEGGDRLGVFQRIVVEPFERRPGSNEALIARRMQQVDGDCARPK
jgi:hypothetical protein